MTTTEELVKKAFNEIGDQISLSTRELLNSIPRLERRVRELEKEVSVENDIIPENEHVADIKSTTEMNEDRPALSNDEKNGVYEDRIKTARNKNTRVKDAEE